MAPQSALNAIAGGQHGVVAFRQMLELGLERWRAQQMVRSQGWARVHPGIYAIGPGDPWCQRVMAACLCTGRDAVASHQTAAKLYGLDGVGPPPRLGTGGSEEQPVPRDVHVSVAASRRPRQRKGIIVHRGRELGADALSPRNGIPCTSLLRTVVDLAGVLEEQELAFAVESAWRADSGFLEDIEPWLDEHGQGIPGIAALRRVLADCMERPHKPMDSALEVRCWRWLKETNLPRPTPQLPYTGHGDYVRFVDFGYLSRKVAIEADGFEFHRDRQSFEKDAAKLSYLAANGWRVIHVTWRMLDTKPGQLRKWIELALQEPDAPGGGTNARLATEER